MSRSVRVERGQAWHVSPLRYSQVQNQNTKDNIVRLSASPLVDTAKVPQKQTSRSRSSRPSSLRGSSSRRHASRRSARVTDDLENQEPESRTGERASKKSSAEKGTAVTSPESPVEQSIWSCDGLREPLLMSLHRTQPDAIRIQSLKTLLNLSDRERLRRELWRDAWLREELVTCLETHQDGRIRELALYVFCSLAKCEANKPEMVGSEGFQLRQALLEQCEAYPFPSSVGKLSYSAKHHSLALYIFTLISICQLRQENKERTPAMALWADVRFVETLTSSARVDQAVDVKEQALRLILSLTSCKELHRKIWEEMKERHFLLDVAADPNDSDYCSESQDNPEKSGVSLETQVLPCPQSRLLALRCISRIALGDEDIQEEMVQSKSVMDVVLRASMIGQEEILRELGVKILSRVFSSRSSQKIENLRENREVLEILREAILENVGKRKNATETGSANQDDQNVSDAGLSFATSLAALKVLVRFSCVPDLQLLLWNRTETRSSLLETVGVDAFAELRHLSLRALANMTCLEDNIQAMWNSRKLREALVFNIECFNNASSYDRAADRDTLTCLADCCNDALRAVANFATVADIQDDVLQSPALLVALLSAAKQKIYRNVEEERETKVREQALRALANIACSAKARRVLWKTAELRDIISSNASATQPAALREQALRIMANITTAPDA